MHSIVLTHSHMDHTTSLPFFTENVFGKIDRAIDIYTSAATVYAMRKHLFNNDTWPDFTRLPNHLLPAVRFHELDDEVPVTLDGVTFTPIAVNHLVPTFGFLIEHGRRGGPLVERHRADAAPLGGRQPHPRAWRRSASRPASTTRSSGSPTSRST